MYESSRNFLNVETQTLAWFNSRAQAEEIQLQPPFQRNPVWQTKQKSALIDTIILGYPIPELYLQTSVDEFGKEKFTVVDGQQRIRACLEFVNNQFALDAESEFPGHRFEDLDMAVQKKIFAYKFIVRALPELPEVELREIFGRLNRNNVALNRQELRQAAYWGEFITTMNSLSQHDFWINSGLFTANDIRRMLDIEYISEIAAGVLFGPQNKKQKLDSLYEDFEEEFPDKEPLERTFHKTLEELESLLSWPTKFRWSRKVDFYTLFLVMAKKADSFPLPRDERDSISEKLSNFSDYVNKFVRQEDIEIIPKAAMTNTSGYARGIRNSSDLNSRRMRIAALSSFLEGKPYHAPQSTTKGVDPLGKIPTIKELQEKEETDSEGSSE